MAHALAVITDALVVALRRTYAERRPSDDLDTAICASVTYWAARDFDIREVFDLVDGVLVQVRDEQQRSRTTNDTTLDTVIFRAVSRCLQAELLRLREATLQGAAMTA